MKIGIGIPHGPAVVLDFTMLTPGGFKHVALGEYANIGKEKVVQIDDHFLSCLCKHPG